MNNKTPKMKSTYHEFMEAKTPHEKENYEQEYKNFVLSEMLLAAMEEDEVSVRELAKLAGVSPTTIQEMRSGTKMSFNTNSFFKVLKSLGYNFLIEKNGEITALDLPAYNKK